MNIIKKLIFAGMFTTILMVNSNKYELNTPMSTVEGLHECVHHSAMLCTDSLTGIDC